MKLYEPRRGLYWELGVGEVYFEDGEIVTVLNHVQGVPSRDAVRSEGAGMDDLTMTRLCAEAAGYLTDVVPYGGKPFDKTPCVVILGEPHGFYDPLHDDEQAMELYKKVPLNIDHQALTHDGAWHVESVEIVNGFCAWVADKDLNRAIVECVARMQAERAKVLGDGTPSKT